MLNELLGNQNVLRALFFLLVNEEGYAHQICSLLSISLSPMQNALQKLEKGGIFKSESRKGTRYYSFNQQYLLFAELEALIKKAYHHLSLREKQRYYYLQPPHTNAKKLQYNSLKEIWDRLNQVSQVRMIVRSNGALKGKGSVFVKLEGWSVFFKEQGVWEKDGGVYKNSFCWTWNRLDDVLSLEHLRMGRNDPKFLFDLHPREGGALESLRPHLTVDDTYFGWLEISELFIHLHIRTLGPRKNEKIEYIYS